MATPADRIKSLVINLQQLKKQTEELKKKIKIEEKAIKLEQDKKFLDDVVKYQVKKYLNNNKDILPLMIKTVTNTDMDYTNSIKSALEKHYLSILNGGYYLTLRDTLVAKHDKDIKMAIRNGNMQPVYIDYNFINEYELRLLINVIYEVDVFYYNYDICNGQIMIDIRVR